jgi:hypothetical protein
MPKLAGPIVALATGQAGGHVEQGIVGLRGRGVAKYGEVIRPIHFLSLNDGVLQLPVLKQVEVTAAA